MRMALYTYDEDADALYVLIAPEGEARIDQTVEISDTVHVDLDENEEVVGVEVLYPARSQAADLAAAAERFGLNIRLPFQFVG